MHPIGVDVSKKELAAARMTKRGIVEERWTIPNESGAIGALLDALRPHAEFVAYAGLDPRVKQSGSTLSRNTRLTKRGSPYLLRAFSLAAMIGECSDPELKAYYDEEAEENARPEGSHRREAIRG